jgi:Fur family transcriptional regulator, ferric uptake regulator
VSEELHETVYARLRAAGQRYTWNRRSLVEVLESADRPLTIAETLRHRPLPQSSAYRNLAVLEQAKVVHRVTGTDEFARYELAEDLTDHHHHHLICTSCGAVSDFTLPPSLERTLEATMANVASHTRFRPERHRLDFIGTCSGCN